MKELDSKLLQSLGLSAESAKIVTDHIASLRAEIKFTRRLAIMEAAREVEGHWNDRTTFSTQYDQAKRSAAVLVRLALDGCVSD